MYTSIEKRDVCVQPVHPDIRKKTFYVQYQCTSKAAGYFLDMQTNSSRGCVSRAGLGSRLLLRCSGLIALTRVFRTELQFMKPASHLHKSGVNNRTFDLAIELLSSWEFQGSNLGMTAHYHEVVICFFRYVLYAPLNCP